MALIKRERDKLLEGAKTHLPAGEARGELFISRNGERDDVTPHFDILDQEDAGLYGRLESAVSALEAGAPIKKVREWYTIPGDVPIERMR